MVLIGLSFGTRIASPLRCRRFVGDVEQRSPAAWAKIGGASPVWPMSMAPALSASSICGPAGEFGPFHRDAEGRELLLEDALALDENKRAVFLEADADHLVLGLTRQRHRNHHRQRHCRVIAALANALIIFVLI